MWINIHVLKQKQIHSSFDVLIGNIENAFPICVRSILDDFYDTPDDLENKVWWFYDSEPATLMPIKSVNYYRQDAHKNKTLVMLASDMYGSLEMDK